MRSAAILCALVALQLAAPSHARTFKIATLAPDGTSWMQEIRKGAARIEEQTEGRVKLKFYPGGVMGNEKTVLRKIRVGQLQGGAFTGGGLVEIYNDMQIYSLPFLFRSHEEVDYVRERMDARLIAGLEERGLVPVGLAGGGFAYLLSKGPVQRREDLDGRKVWIPEGDTMSQIALQTAGVSPVPLPIADVFTGLQTGLVDTVASPPVGAIALQWHTKVKHMVDVPILYLLGAMAVEKRAFSRLSPGDQEIFRGVMGEAFDRLDAAARRDNHSAREALRNQGIRFTEPTPEELRRWHALAAEAASRFEGKDLYSEETYQVLQRHLRDFRSRGQNGGE